MARPTLHVCGDPTADWLVAGPDFRDATSRLFWELPLDTKSPDVSVQAGGAALAAELLRQLLPAGEADVRGITVPAEVLQDPLCPQITRTWTMWLRYPKHGPRDNKEGAYRMQEWLRRETGQPSLVTTDCPAGCGLLVIDDSGLGYHDRWRQVRQECLSDPPEHVLMKLAFSRAGERSPLVQDFADKGLGHTVTVLTAVEHLRKCTARIGASLSWEQILEDVVGAVLGKDSPFVSTAGALGPGRVIVSLGAAGAVIVEAGSSTLIFDRTGQEGDFQDRFPGRMVGYNTCVLSALAAAWARGRGDTDWAAATVEGVGLARALHLEGYQAAGAPDNQALRFPHAQLARLYQSRLAASAGERPNPDGLWSLGTFAVPNAVALDERTRTKWTILQRALSDCGRGGAASAAATADALLACAHAVVRTGPERALPDVPLATVGKWRSADRFEIEGVRSIHNAMRAHLAGRPDRPLAIAVFGPPGAGKSFAIKQIAEALEIPRASQMTFNLSQFQRPEELVSAFQQVRDCHLRRQVPLVFWDEFDAMCGDREYGWLRYFLAPLQDGEFLQDGANHPIGGGIFVFAGGTRRTFEEFRESASAADKAAKKPDFISRLNAFVNVRGPNGAPNIVEDDLYVVRRALLLNSFLERHPNRALRGSDGAFQIHDGVLNAFLRTTRYLNGARSMENLVGMSDLADSTVFAPSSLPPQHLLAMNVEAGEFSTLVRLGYREFLRVGITGHIALDPDRDGELDAGIRRAVQLIQEAFPGRALTVFSPMAQGADRRVARELLSCEGAGVIAVLPLPPDDYIKDFGRGDDHAADPEGADLRQEFRHWLSARATDTVVMPPCATRDEAYLQCGYYVADHCDVLVAVWDGRRKGAGLGSTADVIRRYRRREFGRRRPFCHVWAGNHKDDLAKRTSVGGRHGTVRTHNFPAPQP
jgi:hypothetical protein